MKRALLILLCLIFLGVCASAQEPQQKPEPKPPEAKPAEAQAPEAKAPEAKETEALPPIDIILDKFIESVGGKAAIEKINSRTAKGVFELPAMGASGTWTAYAKAPNKSAVIIDIPGFGVFQQGYDGKIAWENNPMVGMRELSGAELAARKRDSDFYRDIRLRELFSKLTVKAKQKVGERDAYVVEAVPAEGSAEKLYFDVENGLLVRQDIEREGPQGTALIEVYRENYKEIDGMKIPHTIRQVMPQMTILTKFDDIKHNVEIDDAKFVKPATP